MVNINRARLGNPPGTLLFCRPQIYRSVATSAPRREHQIGRVNCRLPPGAKQVGEITMRRSIGDYHSLLADAVSALERGDAEAREEMYERTRAALRTEFDKLDPPSELEFQAERLKLNLAIHDFEYSYD
jgi:hypothetical protein